MKSLSEVLVHVRNTTKVWETEVTPTINLVIEQIYNLTSHLEKLIRMPNQCRYKSNIFEVIV